MQLRIQSLVAQLPAGVGTAAPATTAGAAPAHTQRSRTPVTSGPHSGHIPGPGEGGAFRRALHPTLPESSPPFWEQGEFNNTQIPSAEDFFHATPGGSHPSPPTYMSERCFCPWGSDHPPSPLPPTPLLRRGRGPRPPPCDASHRFALWRFAQKMKFLTHFPKNWRGTPRHLETSNMQH